MQASGVHCQSICYRDAHWRTVSTDHAWDPVNAITSLSHTHTDTHTQKHTPAESSAPTVCSEWNQWVPKGSGGDFCVNSLCLKVKWGKGEAYGGEHSRGEENRAKTNGGVFREKEVSFLTQNAPWSPSYQEEWKARVCSSKRICMAWWALLW